MAIDNPVDIGYSNPDHRTTISDTSVMEYSKVDTRKFSSAFVRSPSVKRYHDFLYLHFVFLWFLTRGSNLPLFHRGGTDPDAPLHMTVEFQDAEGKHITTLHLDRDEGVEFPRWEHVVRAHPTLMRYEGMKPVDGAITKSPGEFAQKSEDPFDVFF